MRRTVKREAVSRRTDAEKQVNNAAATENGNNCSSDGGDGDGDFAGRRVLRSRYLNVKIRISDERDDISNVDSDKFKTMIEEVDNLHQLVKKPREQVADAEALLGITNTLVTSVKAHRNEGLTPSDFITYLLRDYGQQGGPSTSRDAGGNSIHWKNIGLAVSHVFRNAPGCSTMVGPMNTDIKLRKPTVHRKRVRPPTERSRPEELEDTQAEEKTDTDKNMGVMFGILRKNRKVGLERLILNRNSFAQTVENLFALSFLVKDGRAEITVNEQGDHLVCKNHIPMEKSLTVLLNLGLCISLIQDVFLVAPRNAPASSAVLSREVSYNHFIFRFDFRDWKLMMTRVEVGEELMPQRNVVIAPISSQPNLASEEVETAATTPIRKFSRNRGLVLQEQIVEDSPESDDSASRAAAASRKSKRKRKLI